MEHEIVLQYELSSMDDNLDDIVERLGSGGCDDATCGVGQPGRLGLKFTREAPTANEALLRAIADVRRILPSAELIDACPEF